MAKRFFHKKDKHERSEEERQDLLPSGPAGTFRFNIDPDNYFPPPPLPETPPPRRVSEHREVPTPTLPTIPTIEVELYEDDAPPPPNVSDPSLKSRESRYYSVIDYDLPKPPEEKYFQDNPAVSQHKLITDVSDESKPGLNAVAYTNDPESSQQRYSDGIPGPPLPRPPPIILESSLDRYSSEAPELIISRPSHDAQNSSQQRYGVDVSGPLFLKSSLDPSGSTQYLFKADIPAPSQLRQSQEIPTSSQPRLSIGAPETYPKLFPEGSGSMKAQLHSNVPLINAPEPSQPSAFLNAPEPSQPSTFLNAPRLSQTRKSATVQVSFPPMNFLDVPGAKPRKPSFLRAGRSFLSGVRGVGSYQMMRKDDEEELLKDIPLERQPSIILPVLADRERIYFDLVGSGDVNRVKDFLQENPGFNINCIDFEGHSALHIAVLKGDEAMVKFLLEQRHIEVGDCALHAIRLGNINLVTLLLDHLASFIPNLEFCGVANSSDFSADITPLILAAHHGHYEIIGMLLERNHKLIPPHHPRCTCKEVCQGKEDETFRLSTKYARLNVYRALASPAYICHTSSDPILNAFKLCVELQERSRIEEEFRIVYVDLAKEVRNFPVDLINCCRTEEEVEILLSLSDGCDCPGQFKFPRLELAVDYHQKEFVAHPNVQHVLRRSWLGDYYQWHKKNYTLKTLSVLPRIPMIPVIAFMCMIAPNSKRVKYWSLPVNRMISSIASYLVFLVLIFIESNQDKKKQKRGPPQSGLEAILVLFVISHVFSSIRLCMLQGPRRFFSHLWNWYDLINQLLFLLTFFFWLAALVDVHTYGDAELPRKFWHHLDPTLMAEGFFAVATILSFSKLLLLCQLNFYLGPLQVSLGKMTKDLAKFLLIFAIIIISFTAGLCRLYHYYDGMVQNDLATGQKTTQVSSFVNIGETVKTLFWAIFCMAPLESADVIVEDILVPGGNGTVKTITNNHEFTQTVGYIAFALFEVLSVIVILNMLIAAMSNTYQKVADNVDVEWTFGRTQVYLGYMSQTVLPPPFNLLPTPTGLSSMAEWCIVCVRPTKGKRARFSFSHCCFVEKEEPKNVQEEYPEVISQLAQRYFTEKESSGDPGTESGTVVTANIDALKHEILELKTMLKECLTSRS